MSFNGLLVYFFLCAALSLSVVSDSATTWTVVQKAPLSMGFSRQEYWSGFPCPPPGDLPNPGNKPRSPTLQVDYLLSEPPGKTKHMGVGSLSLLQGFFQAQESNKDLLHCKQIICQLSYQGSPIPLSGCGTICLFIHILKDIVLAPKLCEFLLIQKSFN